MPKRYRSHSTYAPYKRRRTYTRRRLRPATRASRARQRHRKSWSIHTKRKSFAFSVAYTALDAANPAVKTVFHDSTDGISAGEGRDQREGRTVRAHKMVYTGLIKWDHTNGTVPNYINLGLVYGTDTPNSYTYLQGTPIFEWQDRPYGDYTLIQNGIKKIVKFMRFKRPNTNVALVPFKMTVYFHGQKIFWDGDAASDTIYRYYTLQWCSDKNNVNQSAITNTQMTIYWAEA